MHDIALIAALDDGNLIGVGNDLPWRLPRDLAHFKALTLGHAVMMGRATYQSIGRPLPRRRNLVLSRNRSFTAPGCDVYADIESALASVRADETLMVIGGARLYEAMLPRAARMHLTHVHEIGRAHV